MLSRLKQYKYLLSKTSQKLTGILISFGDGGVFTGVLSVTSTTSLMGLLNDPSMSLLIGLLPNS